MPKNVKRPKNLRIAELSHLKLRIDPGIKYARCDMYIQRHIALIYPDANHVTSTPLRESLKNTHHLGSQLPISEMGGLLCDVCTLLQLW